MAATLLLPLVDRVPVMAAPCRMHSSIDRITASLAEWTRGVGLDTPASAGFDRMAGRAFAGFGADSTLLFAKWLTWLFHFDDEWDEKPAGRAAGIVEATFARLERQMAETEIPGDAPGTPPGRVEGRPPETTARDAPVRPEPARPAIPAPAPPESVMTASPGSVMTVLRGNSPPPRTTGPARMESPSPAQVKITPSLRAGDVAPLRVRASAPASAGAAPVEVAFLDLWEATAPRMSPRWRERFAGGVAAQGAACRTEAENRYAGRVPSAAEYPALRRGTAGPYLFDLVEPCLGVEVPAELRESPTWRTLVDACNDVTAWCNDVASHHKERANGDVHNYVMVAARAFGLSDADAVAWVNDRIAERAEDLRTAAMRLPGLFDRFGLSPAQARDASKVACAFLGAPRAQLEWLLESSRYDVT